MPFALDPLAILLVPAAAAGAALVLPRRRTGLVNGWTALALVADATVALATTRSPPGGAAPATAGAGSASGVTAPFLAVDGPGLACLTLVPLLALAALAATWREVPDQARARAAALLGTVAALQGLASARDLAFASFCLALAALGAAYLTGGLGPDDRTRAAVRLTSYHLVATGFLLAAAAVLTALPLAPDLAALPGSLRGALLVAVAAGYAVPLGLFPWHGWLAPASAAGGTGALLVVGAWPLVGACGFGRLCVGLFGAELDRWAGVAVTLAAVAALVPALIAVVQPDQRRRLAWAASACSGIVALGLVSRREDAFVGALVWALAQAPLRLVLAWMATSQAAPGEAAAGTGRAGAFRVPTSLAFLGLPGFLAFAGGLLMGADLAAHWPWQGAVALVALGLVTAALLLPAAKLAWQAPTGASVAAAVVLAASLGLGLRPQPLVELVRPAARSALAGQAAPASGPASEGAPSGRAETAPPGGGQAHPGAGQGEGTQ